MIGNLEAIRDWVKLNLMSKADKAELDNEIAAIKDGDTLESFGDVEEVLDEINSTLNYSSITNVKKSTITSESEGNIAAINLYGSTEKNDDELIIPSGKVESGNKNLFILGMNTKTTNGITLTANLDGSVTANGTATADAYFGMENDIPVEVGEHYIVSFGFSDGTVTTKYGFINFKDANGNNIGSATSLYNVSEKEVIPPANTEKIRMQFAVKSGQTVNNFTFYPMLRKADIEDATFVKGKHSSINAKNILPNFDLVSVGNLKNEIHVFADGSGEIIERAKKLNNSTVLIGQINTDSTNTTRFRLKPIDDYVGTEVSTTDFISTLDGKVIYNLDEEGVYINATDSTKEIWCRVNKSSCGTTEESIRAWMMDNFKFVYPIMPTITPLTKTQVSEFLKLKIFDVVTYLESDTSIDVKYIENEVIADVNSKVERISEIYSEIIVPDDSDAWNSTTSYINVGQCVIDNNMVYELLVANSGQRPSTSPSYWKKVTLSELNKMNAVESFDASSSGFSAPNVTIDWTKSVMKKCGNICHFSFLITATQSIAQFGSIIKLPSAMSCSNAVRIMPASDLPCAMDETPNIYATQAITAASGTKYLSGTYIIN